MMYNNKLAVAIKTNGKVLREVNGDTVYIPFGSEYSIFIKNLNNVRVTVTISIDGDDITDGDRFIVGANDSVTIERSLRKGNLAEGNRFKFIERTGAIEEHRGIEIDDGLVRVEYQFEKPMPEQITKLPYHFTDMDPYYTHPVLRSTGMPPPATYGHQITCNVSNDSLVGDAVTTMAVNETGITTEGSISDQQFTTVDSFPTEAESYVMVLKLLGEVDGTKVAAAVTTKTKPVCNKCGTVGAKFDSKFCSACGTSLIII